MACMGFMVSACSANNRYNRMVTKADTFITGLEEENRQAEDELQKKEKELKALEHEVYYAQTDIPAGQLISGDMVKRRLCRQNLMTVSLSMLRIWEVWPPVYRSKLERHL